MTTASDGTAPPAGGTGQGTTDPGTSTSQPGTAATGTPPAGETPPAGTAGSPAPKAPEAYQPFTVGEGVTLDAGFQALAEPVFRQLDLDQAGAQALVGVYEQIAQELDRRSTDAHATLVAGWKEAGKKDAEFGGANYDSTIEKAGALVARYGDDELKQFLETTGLGNHPGLLRMFARIGKHFSEATVIPPAGAGAAAGKKELADLLYGGTKK